jgi:subtilisin family serine protease
VKICLKKCLLTACITACIATCLFTGWQMSVSNYAVAASSSPLNNDAGRPAVSPGIPPGPTSADSRLPGNYQAISGFKALWSRDQINTLSLSQINDPALPVIIAVLDTGIDKNHEELIGMVVAEINLSHSAAAGDIYGHGTSIAGIIAANAANGLGISGIAPKSRLLSVKVTDDAGRCNISTLAEGIIRAVDYGAKVINISLELKTSAPDLQKAVDYAWEKGAVIIAAAGNDGSSLAVYPAFLNNCIAVTAVKENGALAPLANYGDWVDVAAPGYGIYSTLPGNSYGFKYGTSYAAAYISGLAAVLFSSVTDINGNGRLNDDVRRAIETGFSLNIMPPGTFTIPSEF